MIYDRAEDMLATTKRHPSRTRHRTAVTRDGKLAGHGHRFHDRRRRLPHPFAGRAFSRHDSRRRPLSIARTCASIVAAVATNAPPHGAFRGFGAPQSVFALERHLDRVAQVVGLAPEELRRRNFIQPGQTLAVHQVVRENVDMAGLMDRAFQLCDYHAKRKRFQQENRHNVIKKGIGFASFLHGAGFTGSGEEYLASEAALEVSGEGRVRVFAGSTEMGQGTNTVFTQIAAEALGIDCDQIEIAQPDTAQVPNSGPTVASRTTMIVGKLVETSARTVQKCLFDSGLLNRNYSAAEFKTACAAYIEKHGPLQSLTKYQYPHDLHWDDERYQGDAYGAYAWAVYVAEVSVDTRTAEVRVEDFVAVQEVGKVINPVLAAGQIEGGVAQGMGFALYENCVWQQGRMINGQMTNYIIPTSMDVPPIRVFFEEIPYERGPAGAKGIGELPLDGTAPAIANAIAHATGAEITRIPITAEVLLNILESVHVRVRAQDQRALHCEWPGSQHRNLPNGAVTRCSS